MPRTATINQADVDAICARLLEQGKPPTLRLVIAEHGSGSQGTVQPLLKDWQRRRQSEQPAAPEHVLSPDLLKALSKQFSRDLQIALADVKDQLEASEEANSDLARENEALNASLRQREAELVALSDRDAVVRGQVEQLENDLERLRAECGRERAGRIESERKAAAAGAQRDDLREQLQRANQDVAAGIEREQQQAVDLAAARVDASKLDERLNAAMQHTARIETELEGARQAEQTAIEQAAELRGQLRSVGS